jgi:hypothetical protein
MDHTAIAVAVFADAVRPLISKGDLVVIFDSFQA